MFIIFLNEQVIMSRFALLSLFLGAVSADDTVKCTGDFVIVLDNSNSLKSEKAEGLLNKFASQAAKQMFASWGFWR